MSTPIFDALFAESDEATQLLVLDAFDHGVELDVDDAFDEADEMCPNCVTPWKCNGPHIDLAVSS